MEPQKTEEKKVWIKPQLVVYGEIEKLTTESISPVGTLPGHSQVINIIDWGCLKNEIANIRDRHLPAGLEGEDSFFVKVDQV